MPLNVHERGSHVATFRWIDVRLMEMLAAWVPTTPEMEVKLVFGAHIWDIAQHADSLGKRTQELRLPLQHSLPPSTEYARFLEELASTTDTARRIAGFYDCALPGLEARLSRYVERVDPLLDGPTVRILERIRGDIARMLKEGQALRDEVPAVRLEDGDWIQDLRRREASLAAGMVRPSSSPQAAATP
jgi:hypothetical protein